MGKIYFYKGFKIHKGNNPYYGNYYFVGNEKDGQIAPSDNVAPRSLKECKAIINEWLNEKRK